ncbi:MAG: hypothetical protein KIS96_11495 [Bauldia sp.]|nr:hypothetical protein [Bauldia sp.]
MNEWPFINADGSALERGAYDVTVVDPPWDFKGNSVAKPGRNARRHYRVMSLKEIAALPVGDLCRPSGGNIVCWITGPFLAAGAHLPLFKAWGYKPTAIFATWIKLKRSHNPKQLRVLPSADGDFHVSTGMTTRKNAEFVIIGKRGRPLRRARGDVRELIIAPVREHSRKPDDLRDRVAAYFGPAARVCELFSREDRPGWDCWGDEAGKFDARAA